MSKEEFPHEKDLKDEVTPDKAPKKDPKGTRSEKGLCLVSDVFLKLENIKLNKIKVSEMGK